MGHLRRVALSHKDHILVVVTNMCGMPIVCACDSGMGSSTSTSLLHVNKVCNKHSGSNLNIVYDNPTVLYANNVCSDKTVPAVYLDNLKKGTYQLQRS